MFLHRIHVVNNNYLKELLPRLFTFAKNQNISVAAFLQDNTVQRHFHTPLSEEAFQELESLQGMVQQLQEQTAEKDVAL